MLVMCLATRIRWSLLAAMALAGTLAIPSALRADVSPAQEVKARSFAALLKQQQKRQLLSEYAHSRRERRERIEAIRAARRGRRMKPVSGEGVLEPAAAASALRRLPFPTRADGVAFPPANVRVNSPDSESVGSGQAEVSIAAIGQYVVSAYNDGEGYNPPLRSTQGVSYSTNGGLTWTDFGMPPILATWRWTSDPVVMADEKKNAFYFCALVDIGTTSNGIAMVKLTFAGVVPTWGTPVLIVSATNATVFDKQWMAADSLNGNLYVSYTKFTSTNGSEIFFQRSLTDGATWLAASKLSAGADDGLVQGSRVVVGPAGEVYVAWYTIGLVDVDFYKIRKSVNAGLLFGASFTAANVYHAFANGAPGFNRGNAVDFPSLAVDRSTGVHRGRVYMTWHESVNYYGDGAYFDEDSLGNPIGPKSEVELNNTPGTANSFQLGQTLRGTFSAAGDQDWFSFGGKRGQTVVAIMDSLNGSIDNIFRLFCSDGVTRLTLSAPGPGVGYGGQIVFTLPSDGVYYLRPFSNAGTGGYAIHTAVHRNTAARARDHRDVFVTYSDLGTSTWSTPVLVNNDPGWFDNWLPEVAVAGGSIPAYVGQVYVGWFDWRDSPAVNCGGVSNLYMSRSGDGGASWNSLGTISDAQSFWTTVASNIAPNQGDYLALFANGVSVWPAWSDGRTGDPNVFTVRLDLGVTATDVSLVSADANADRISLVWYEAGDRLPATVYRRVAGAEWIALATIDPDGLGYVRYEDRAIVAGASYEYRLGIMENGVPRFVGEVSVSVPLASRFALGGVHPNPTARELKVSFSLPDALPATLALVDISGRLVRNSEVGSLGAGPHVVDLAAGDRLPPGIYLVRLMRAGRTLTTRVSVIR
jgi:hypothetical protein